MKMIKSCVFVCFFLAACFNLYAQSGESWDPIEKDVKPSGTLPVVYINTENSAPIDQKINYIPATAWIADPQGVYNLGSELEPVTLGIRGRGNVTWSSYDKKPYKIKFDKKQALLDMPKSKHWVLRAFVEGSLDRYPDYLGTLLANLVGMKWTPTQRPCEVVLNGQYTGLYYLGESIRIESTRLNIYEQPEGETNEEIVKKGGYLAELSNYADDENSVRLDSKTPTWLAFNIHNPDNITEPQKEFLFDEFTKIDEALCQSNQNDNYAELIDSH